MSSNTLFSVIPRSIWCILSGWRKILSQHFFHYRSPSFSLSSYSRLQLDIRWNLSALSGFLNCSFLFMFIFLCSVLGIFLVLSLNLLLFILSSIQESFLHEGMYFSILSFIVSSFSRSSVLISFLPILFRNFLVFYKCYSFIYLFTDPKMALENSFSDSSIIVISSGMNLSTHCWFKT